MYWREQVQDKRWTDRDWSLRRVKSIVYLSNLVTYRKILTLLPKFCSLESPESHSFVISLQPNIPYVHHNAVVFVTWIPKMMRLEKATPLKNSHHFWDQISGWGYLQHKHFSNHFLLPPRSPSSEKSWKRKIASQRIKWCNSPKWWSLWTDAIDLDGFFFPNGAWMSRWKFRIIEWLVIGLYITYL